jgi:hypothetical protein
MTDSNKGIELAEQRAARQQAGQQTCWSLRKDLSVWPSSFQLVSTSLVSGYQQMTNVTP